MKSKLMFAVLFVLVSFNVQAVEPFLSGQSASYGSPGPYAPVQPTTQN